MKLAVVIQHAPWVAARRANVAHLSSRLRREGGCTVDVVEDTQRAGLWPTRRRAWKTGLSRAPDYVLMLEDDALLCRDFIAGVAKVVEARPEACITLFAMRQSLRKAQKRGVHWVASSYAVSDLATVMPAAWVADFIRWEATCFPQGHSNRQSGDGRRVLWLLERGQKGYYTAPSLADHLMPSDSVVGHSDYRRVSRWYIGDGSPLDIDWTRGIDNPVLGVGTSLTRYVEKLGLVRHPNGKLTLRERV